MNDYDKEHYKRIIFSSIDKRTVETFKQCCKMRQNTYTEVIRKAMVDYIKTTKGFEDYPPAPNFLRKEDNLITKENSDND